MTNPIPLEHSRALRLGADVSALGESALLEHLSSSSTAVSFEPDLPGGILTTEVLLATLARLPGRLFLDAHGLDLRLVQRLVALVQAIAPQKALETSTPSDTVIRVHIGVERRQGAIRGVPEAYGAHIVADTGATIYLSRDATGLGCVLTASMLVGEVFKHVAAVLPERRSAIDYLKFCPVSLSDDLHRAPDLKTADKLSLALVGVGAVGTAHALILSHLPLSGQVALVDDQILAPENIGTYSLGGQADVEAKRAKVDLAARQLRGWKALPFPKPVSTYISALDAREVPWPRIVLSGLDSVEARYDAQRLWPDHFIDAATGDTGVGLQHCQPSGPCIRCFLPRRAGAESALAALVTATGLNSRFLAEGDQLLTEDEKASAPVDKQVALALQVGKPKCGLAAAFGLSAVDSGGYRPSIPFVSQQAACLGVGRLVALLTGMELPSNFYQYDALIGPQMAEAQARNALNGCYCQVRAGVVAKVRQQRRQ